MTALSHIYVSLRICINSVQGLFFSPLDVTKKNDAFLDSSENSSEEFPYLILAIRNLRHTHQVKKTLRLIYFKTKKKRTPSYFDSRPYPTVHNVASFNVSHQYFHSGFRL